MKKQHDRADALVKNAQRNIDQKGIDSPRQYGENYKQGTPLGERVKNLGEDIGSSAEEFVKVLLRGLSEELKISKEIPRMLPKT